MAGHVESQPFRDVTKRGDLLEMDIDGVAAGDGKEVALGRLMAKGASVDAPVSLDERGGLGQQGDVAHPACLYARLADPSHTALLDQMVTRQVVDVRVREAREARKEEHVSGDALVTSQLRIVQIDDAPQLVLGNVTRCADVPADGVAHEGIGVDDTPFVQVFEERRQHGKIAGGGVEFEGLLMRKVGLEILDKGLVHLVHGEVAHSAAMPKEGCEMPPKNPQELVPAFTAIDPHPLPKASEVFLQMIEQALAVALKS